MQGTPKAIQIQGIVRNATVIGAQDGQAEDLINLRFMDGSWRASGDGRMINFIMGAEYTQLYVHTNVYHHLLGVNNGTLYWFAEIGTDGVTFYPLDNTTSRTNWPQDMQSLPTSPVALTTVIGDIWITQNGHLLTIIDENDDFEHLVFKTDNKEYMVANVDANGDATDRKLFPFGRVHFNLFEPDRNSEFRIISSTSTSAKTSAETIMPEYDEDGDEVEELVYTEHFVRLKPKTLNLNSLQRTKFERWLSTFPTNPYYENYEPDELFWITYGQRALSYLTRVRALADERNLLTRPFLAIAALKMYDGSYIYASQPVLLIPRENPSFYDSSYTLCIKEIMEHQESISIAQSFLDEASTYNSDYRKIYIRQSNEKCVYIPSAQLVHKNGVWLKSYDTIDGIDKHFGQNLSYSGTDIVPAFTNGATLGSSDYDVYQAAGSDIVISFDFSGIEDSGLFSHLAIFVTPQAEIYDYSQKGSNYNNANGNDTVLTGHNISYVPKMREKDKIIHDLMHSPFYLLKEVTLQEVANEKVLHIRPMDIGEGVVTNIVQQNRLDYESTIRTTYIPNVSYMYNGRLHIANYKSFPFFGFPIDLFNLHNHSVKVQINSWYKGVLQSVSDNGDAYQQYPKAQIDITNYADLVTAGAPYFLVKVFVDSSRGEQVVCRYIPAYNPSPAVNGRADFIEDLNPLLTYPDARAKKMEIYYIKDYEEYVGVGGSYSVLTLGRAIFPLKPHPYLNMAYFITPDLKPISLDAYNVEDIEYTSPTAADMQALVKMQNTEEYFPNGLKVSKTDNPMFFPVENAYQVGSAEILALMSNTIAVGTGQTGAAPLYVFCKDGVYALFVDASGQMTYSNSRVLARDVCNNPRSVTPIDAGVVFTTDRGLMMIAGEQVEEIGQPAEGDVLRYVDSTKVDYSKYAFDALTKIAGLPSSLCDTTDFLTYLQGAIVNYNHNMRELIVTNTNKSYSYVLDREGNWSRRDYTAAQYVNNYPTSYRVAVETVNNQQVRKFYKLDDEGDASTSLEHRKEADNRIFYLSNVIKLDSIGFKQAYRFVVRGYFEAQTDQNVGIVVEGSYDGVKFAPLGFNRKTGKFTNICCHVSHTDVRFYRVILCGQVTGKTRIDYMELSADGSKLNTKIR